jgi:arginyl-tRNA synthetase
MLTALNPFAQAAARAVGCALGVDPEILVVSAPPSPELGDFAVGCFPAAKQLKIAPAALAAQAAQSFRPGPELDAAGSAGPFVNFRANRNAAYHYIFQSALGSGDLLPSAVGSGKNVCIDYSSPNISKHLAYHHIRSTVIGHALVKLYRSLGYRVIGINHLGDWGTTHGMLLAAYHRWGAPEPLTIDVLNQLYVRFREQTKTEPALAQEGRDWFKRLEDGDDEARRLWQHFKAVSLAEFQGAYDLLGIHFDEVRGESDYLQDVPTVLDLLAARGLSQLSDGALVVPFEEQENLPPLLLRKQDGATLYGTRDLAAAIYRWNSYHFERSLYVVDRGQALHFRQLFGTLARAGFAWAERCIHVPFGLVRIGGRKTGTRSGNVVLLKEVLGEAQRISRERIAEQNPTMPSDALDSTARAVGVGAIVFANLVSQRDKDVDFSLEEVLSWEGDAGPYVQYAHARAASILRKAEGMTPDPEVDPSPLTHPLEWGLARELLDFPDAVARAVRGNEPHVVSRYLLDLCATYSRWYTAGSQDAALRVLCSDRDTAQARLALVAAVRSVLERGLGLLGMEAPAAM